ncbi:MAG TPA: hypothetical protein VIH89_05775 [Candidatus Sulfotelmatobacter sp.]
MKSTVTIFALIALLSLVVSGQQPTRPDPLLDRMTGRWILQGTIAGRQTTHDIESDWVLNREYVRMHETSREKNAQGQPAYEAIVFIEWNESSGEYKCLWLDSTSGGGLSAQTMGHGKRNGDEIAFLFNSPDGSSIHTAFSYNKNTGTWQWLMDNEVGGKLTPFARVKLTRK